MLKHGKILLISIFVMLLLTVSCVCAAEDNMTDRNPSNETLNLENEAILTDEGWVDATEAYDSVDEYRTQESVWYWNYDDETITYFNTNDDNRLKPLVRDPVLEEVAKVRAKELSELFSHYRPDGTYCDSAFPNDLIGIGECISYAATGHEAVETWKEDPFFHDGQGHRRCQLSPDYNCIGIGAYRDSTGRIYWAEAFGIREIYYDNKTAIHNQTSFDSSKGTFYDLNNMIENSNYIKLETDYIYYNDSSFKDGIVIKKTLTIDGCGHTIDADNIARIFNITADNVTLKNIKFINAFSDYGYGAIHSIANNLIVINCSFNSNFAYYGAALSSIRGNISLTCCSFNDNYAVEGSIYSNCNNVRIINCSFNNNSAILYGAVTSYNSNISIFNSSFSDNADYKGGALYLINCSGLMANSNFNNNSAIYDAGAVYLASGNFSYQNCSFTGNFIDSENFANEGGISPRGDYSNGGAIFSSDGVISLLECSFINNAIYAIYPANGGGVYSRNSIVFIENCSFTDSKLKSRISSCQGGALYLAGGNVSVKCCTFNTSSSNSWGGSAIFLIENTDNTIMDCSFNDNRNAHALDLRYTKGTVLNCSFTDNDGAIYSTESTISILDCSFTNNSAIYGGSLYLNYANVSLRDCNFANNSASEYGGAVYSNYCNMSLEKCTFIKNHAVYGGALYLNENNAFITDNEFNNSDAITGGAIYVDKGIITVLNSMFYNNTAIDGAATFNCNAFNCTFAENFASNQAGAMYGKNNTADICTFIKNRAVVNSPTYNVVTTECIFEDNRLIIYADFITQYLDSSYYQGDVLYIYLYDFKSSEWLDNATATIRAYKNNDLTGTFNFVIGEGWKVDIPDGTYLFKFTVENQDYIVGSYEKSFEILKKEFAEINVTVENKTYPEAIIADITCSVDGQAYIYINDEYFECVTLTGNKNTQCTYDFNAGKYTLTITVYPTDSKIGSSTILREFEVYKKQTQITLEVKDAIEDENVIVNAKTSDDGFLTVNVGGHSQLYYVNANVEKQFDFGLLERGTYNVTASFTVDENHEDTNTSKTIKVFSKISEDCVIVSIPENNFKDLVISLPVNAEGKITFNIAGESYEADIVDGKANIKLPDLTENNPYTIIYSGDDKYAAFNMTGNLKINKTTEENKTDTNKSNENKTNPKITIPPLDKPAEDRSITITLPNDTTGTITLTINDKNYTYNVKNGEAKIEIPNLENGDYPYTITYSGDSKYFSFTDEGNLKVNRTSSENKTDVDNSKIISSNVNVLYSAGQYYSIKVYGADGKLADGEKVLIKVNGKTFKSLTTTNGTAKFKVTNVPGTYKMNITALDKSVIKTLTVKHLLTLKSVTVKKSAKKLVLTATLAKVNKKYLKNKKLTFKFNGKKYTAKTNSKGVAKVTVQKSVLSKLKAGKKITYQATYLKDTVKKTVKVLK